MLARANMGRNHAVCAALSTVEVSLRSDQNQEYLLVNAADSIFYELTRSMYPRRKKLIDAEIHLKGCKVIMRKRCDKHGRFEILISPDAKTYIDQLRYNKPRDISLEFSTEVKGGGPYVSVEITSCLARHIAGRSWSETSGLPTIAVTPATPLPQTLSTIPNAPVHQLGPDPSY